MAGSADDSDCRNHGSVETTGGQLFLLSSSSDVAPPLLTLKATALRLTEAVHPDDRL